MRSPTQKCVMTSNDFIGLPFFFNRQWTALCGTLVLAASMFLEFISAVSIAWAIWRTFLKVSVASPSNRHWMLSLLIPPTNPSRRQALFQTHKIPTVVSAPPQMQQLKLPLCECVCQTWITVLICLNHSLLFSRPNRNSIHKAFRCRPITRTTRRGTLV